MTTFLSTTLWTLYSASQKLDGVSYQGDARVQIKEEIITLDILMTH